MEHPSPYIDDITSFDKYISVTVKLDNENIIGGNIATLKWRATDANGFTIGRAHNNPLLDTRDYEVDLYDGLTDGYFSNIISENLYYQLDSQGHQNLVMSGIVDYKIDGSTVTNEYGFTWNHSNIPKKTIKGCEFLIEFKYQKITWVDIKYINQAIPIELDEYALANYIADNPGLALWVPYTLKNRNIIISKLKKVLDENS